jgi:WD40 repeat protein
MHFGANGEYVDHLVFIPKTDLLASVGVTSAEKEPRLPISTIRLWDPKAAKEVRAIPKLVAATLYKLAASQDGRMLASGGKDGTVRLWDVGTGEEIRPRGEQQSGLYEGFFSSNGRFVITTSGDRQVRMWDAATGKCLRRFEGEQINSNRAVISKDGKLLVTSGGRDPQVRFWDAMTGNLLRTLEGHSYFVTTIAIAPDGGTVFTCGTNPLSVRTWDAATGQMRREHSLPFGELIAATFSRDAKLFALGESAIFTNQPSSKLHIVDVESGKELRQWIVPPSHLVHVEFSPDGRHVALAGHDLVVWLYDVNSGKEFRQLYAPTSSSGASLAFSPDGRRLMVGGWPMTCFEVATGQLCYYRDGWNGQVGSRAFASDGRRLVTAYYDTTGMIWDFPALVNSGAAAMALETIWEQFANPDASKAFQGMWQLLGHPDRATTFLRTRLRPAQPIDAQLYRQLLTRLENEQFKVREQSAKDLEELGDPVLPLIRESLAGQVSIEVRRRLESLQQKLEGPVTSPDLMRALRAIEALEHIGTADAKQILAKLAAGAPEAMVTREAKASLDRLAK